MKRTVLLFAMMIISIKTSFLSAQTEEFISYILDTKNYHLTEVRLEYHPGDGYIHIEGIQNEKIDMGEKTFPRFQTAQSGISFDIVPQADTFIATHTARSSDILPVYVNWYTVNKKESAIEDSYAGMDSGDESIRVFSVTIENFDGKGSLVRGTFSGKLFDENGNLHTVTNGKFAIRRTDVE
jgi:hypothetical protein